VQENIMASKGLGSAEIIQESSGYPGGVEIAAFITIVLCFAASYCCCCCFWLCVVRPQQRK